MYIFDKFIRLAHKDVLPLVDACQVLHSEGSRLDKKIVSHIGHRMAQGKDVSLALYENLVKYLGRLGVSFSLPTTTGNHPRSDDDTERAYRIRSWFEAFGEEDPLDYDDVEPMFHPGMLYDDYGQPREVDRGGTNARVLGDPKPTAADQVFAELKRADHHLAGDEPSPDDEESEPPIEYQPLLGHLLEELLVLVRLLAQLIQKRMEREA